MMPSDPVDDPRNITLHIGPCITRHREELELSKAALGRLVGVSGQAISLYESGAEMQAAKGRMHGASINAGIRMKF
jgi:DNA-binding XRE family transcriptional regulator